MPIFTERDDIQCWIRVTVVEQYEAYDDKEYKDTLKAEVLKDASALDEYVNDELMPLEFPDWDNKRGICAAIMNTVDWDELLEDIKSDIEENDEDDEDDDWMEIYSQHETFKAFCGDHKHLKPYHDFRYFQCWGGGDEGGFIMNDKDETYKVNRGWGEPFSVEPVDGILDIGHRHGVEQLRVIPKKRTNATN